MVTSPAAVETGGVGPSPAPYTIRFFDRGIVDADDRCFDGHPTPYVCRAFGCCAGWFCLTELIDHWESEHAK